MTSRRVIPGNPWVARFFWCLTAALAALLLFLAWKLNRIHSEQAAHPLRVVTDSGALNLPPALAPGEVPPGSRFVASKNGKKYYPLGSPSAARLSEENKIYFPDAQSAEAAGYVR